MTNVFKRAAVVSDGVPVPFKNGFDVALPKALRFTAHEEKKNTKKKKHFGTAYIRVLSLDRVLFCFLSCHF